MGNTIFDKVKTMDIDEMTEFMVRQTIECLNCKEFDRTFEHCKKCTKNYLETPEDIDINTEPSVGYDWE